MTEAPPIEHAPGSRAPAPATAAVARSPLLATEGLSKRFGSVLALDQVDFQLQAGEIHALLGENGAGKSTLMHVVSGLVAPSSGTIALDGKRVRWRSPDDGRAAGIAMVHQHFMLVPTMTIAENVALARHALGPLRRARLTAEVSELARARRLDIGDPARRIEDLSVGEQQRVEILKALVAPVGLLILDEPTAVLTPDEVTELFSVLRELARQGTAIVLVTHKLYEALSLADRVTVLGHGRVRGSGPAAGFDERSLARLMVEKGAGTEAARDDARPATAAPAALGPILTVERVTVGTPSAPPLLDAVSFELRPGHILAVAGVEGNGQAELVRAISGTLPRALLHTSSGRVRIDGRAIASAPAARAAGLAVIPADRQRDALVKELEAWENLLLSRDSLSRAAPHGWISRASEREHALALLDGFAVRPRDPALRAGAFSGGNQQRIVLARELGQSGVRVVVAANPTRGLDIAATAAIHERFRALAAAGIALLLLSTDLDEVLALGDSVYVLFRGRLHGPLAQPVSRGEVGRLMAGGEEAA
ncbi:MAG TPA: ATP-binding cassette domain-containing protein [Candidatus Bathyarchaeia archaeon]|nr:ATP-binding cassette domain-containing protein [Candidatus Bathyarchaeia archaeon]